MANAPERETTAHSGAAVAAAGPETVLPEVNAALGVEAAVGPAPVERRRGIGGLYYGWWLVGAAFVAQLVSVGAQNYIIGPFMTPMSDDLGWTRSEFTLARTIGQFVLAGAGLFIGVQVDKAGARRLMQVGVLILGATLFAISYVQTLWQWWLLNGIALTVGAAMIGNLVVNVTLSKWFVEKRGRAVGFAAMGVSFAGIAITPSTTLIIDAIGWRDTWKVLAVAAPLIILPISLLMRRAPEDHGLHPDGRTDAEIAAGGGQAAAADFAGSMTRQQALRTRTFYLVVFGFGLGALSIGVMLVQTIPYLTDAGYSRGMAAFMITLTSIPAMATKPLWGWLVDKVDPRRLAATGFFINAISMLAIVAAVRSGIEPAVWIAFFMLGFGWGGLIPLQEVIWGSFFGRRYLGSVRSAALPFALILQASSPVLSSYYFDRVGNYDGAFFAIAALAILAMLLLLSAKRPTRPDPVPVT